MTTMILYGRPPLVFDPPGTATQTSPLIPGSTALESLPDGAVEGAMIYAPPGVLERRYALALALRALKPGGRLDVMAYCVTLATKGYRGAMVIDLRGVRDQAGLVSKTVARLRTVV